MLRVMLLLTDLERGGLPLRVARLAPRLANEGIEPIVGCLKGPGPLSSELEQSGIQTFACGGRGKLDASCLVRLARHIRRFAPDLLHASLFHANLAARMVGRLDRPRPIITATVTIEIERPWHRWLESLSGHLSDYHVANSRAVAEHLVNDLGFPPQRISIIPNAVDIDSMERTPLASRDELGIDDATPLIVWAGRMDPVKNLELFVECVRIIASRRRVAAILMGDGPERKRIERLIASHGLREVIHLVGWQKQPERWFKVAELLLFPSWTEGSSNVVLEAMACGLAIVASDIPANREMLQACGTADLCPPGDADCFVESARQRLMEGRGRRSAANALLERHSLKAVTRAWASLYGFAHEAG